MRLTSWRVRCTVTAPSAGSGNCSTRIAGGTRGRMPAMRRLLVTGGSERAGMGDASDAGQAGELLGCLGGVLARHHDDGGLDVVDGGLESGFSGALADRVDLRGGRFSLHHHQHLGSPLDGWRSDSCAPHHPWRRQITSRGQGLCSGCQPLRASQRPLTMLLHFQDTQFLLIGVQSDGRRNPPASGAWD